MAQTAISRIWTVLMSGIGIFGGVFLAFFCALIFASSVDSRNWLMAAVVVFITVCFLWTLASTRFVGGLPTNPYYGGSAADHWFVLLLCSSYIITFTIMTYLALRW